MSVSLMEMLPDFGRSRPRICRNNVLFPEPLPPEQNRDLAGLDVKIQAIEYTAAIVFHYHIAHGNYRASTFSP